MARLLVHVEGQTEETFVNEVLRSYLLHCGYESVSARIVGNARLRRSRGGIRPWLAVRRDIINHLRQDPGCVATTMVDFYGLPKDGDRAWPGRAAAVGASGHHKASIVEEALRNDLAHEIGANFDITRFLPFVVVHEFEGLLFSDCAAFARGICRPDLEPSFSQIRQGFATPEEINDSSVTAPSKRVEGLVLGYNKPLLGALAIMEIGLDPIRAECPHFNRWLHQLESLVA
ncbi:MAG: DUF4276 family protein [Terriglobia bacterium]|jgi:hypothetical protein